MAEGPKGSFLMEFGLTDSPRPSNVMSHLFGNPNKSPNQKNIPKPKKELRWRALKGFSKYSKELRPQIPFHMSSSGNVVSRREVILNSFSWIPEKKAKGLSCNFYTDPGCPTFCGICPIDM